MTLELLDLPVEILENIFFYLDIKSYIKTSKCSRYLQNLLSNPYRIFMYLKTNKISFWKFIVLSEINNKHQRHIDYNKLYWICEKRKYLNYGMYKIPECIRFCIKTKLEDLLFMIFENHPEFVKRKTLTYLANDNIRNFLKEVMRFKI